MTETSWIMILVGLTCGSTGFGLSQLLSTITLKSKVDVHTSQIDQHDQRIGQTLGLIEKLFEQNTTLIARLGVKGD